MLKFWCHGICVFGPLTLVLIRRLGRPKWRCSASRLYSHLSVSWLRAITIGELLQLKPAFTTALCSISSFSTSVDVPAYIKEVGRGVSAVLVVREDQHK